MKIETINKKEELYRDDIAQILQDVGISRIESLTLVALIHNKKMAAREIERWTDLRQPEVSRACTMLQERGWIKEGDKIACTGKGRPQQVYELSLKFEGIIENIKKEQEKEINDRKEKMKQLSNII